MTLLLQTFPAFIHMEKHIRFFNCFPLISSCAEILWVKFQCSLIEFDVSTTTMASGQSRVRCLEERMICWKESAFTSVTRSLRFKKRICKVLYFREYINLGYTALLPTVVDKLQHLFGLSQPRLFLLFHVKASGGVCVGEG